MTSPARTVALVVGIGDYAKYKPWCLPGPVNDAAHVTDWLLRSGVPPDSIHLLLSPAPQNVAALLMKCVGKAPPAGAERCVALEPTQANVLETVRKLRHTSGEVLVVFWAGHGLVGRQRVQRLLLADAEPEDMWNLPVVTLRDSLRSDHFDELRTQVFFLDVCAVPFDEQVARRRLPTVEITEGIEQTWRQQVVLTASSYGQSATESEGRGAFTTALLEEVATMGLSPWPPDIETLNGRLHARFVAARNGAGGQVPAMWRFVGDTVTEYASPTTTPMVLSTAKPRVDSVRRVDRDRQTQAFGRFFSRDTVTAHRDRPHAVIVYGDEAEGHHSLVLRVVSDYVQEIAQRALGLTASPPVRELPWPGEGSDPDDLKQELVRAMFAAAAAVHDPAGGRRAPSSADDGATEETPWALLRRLGLEKEPLIVFHQSIVVAQWNPAQRELLRWYLDDFWHLPPTGSGAPPMPHVLIFIKVICDPALSQLSVRSLFSGQLTPKRTLRRDLTEITAAGERGCRRTLLDELAPVPFSALKRWFVQEAIDRWMTEREALVAAKRIFALGGTSVDHLPMADIEAALAELIDPDRKAS